MSEQAEKKTTKKENSDPEFDAKGMIKTNSEKNTKIKYGERKSVEIIKDTKYLKAGRVISPHLVMADQMIKDKIAVAVK